MTASSAEAAQDAGPFGLEQRGGLLLGQLARLDGIVEALLELRTPLGAMLGWAELLLRGIRAIFDHEIWIPRRKMAGYLLEGGRHLSGSPLPAELTAREVQILTALSRGESNRAIADKLCISPHTVKTHLYRIFKKIAASNRLQAAQWAAQNLWGGASPRFRS